MPKKKTDEFSVKYTLAAPCGIYCGACRHHLADRTGIKTACEGCRIRNKNCAFIRKDCPQLRNGTIKFCHECDRMPCDKLKRMDGIYTKKYGTSLVGNLERMRDVGVDTWLEEQRKTWMCPACGGRLCIHDAKCVDCGAPLKR